MGFLNVDSTANIYNIYKHTVTIVLINNCARFSLQFVIPDAEWFGGLWFIRLNFHYMNYSRAVPLL